MGNLKSLQVLLLGLLLQHVHSRKASSLELEKSILNKILDNYDSSIRPAGPNGTGPVVVHVNTYIRSISNMDDAKMTYETQLTFRQQWVDERLKYDAKGMSYVTLSKASKIWVPDAFFSNEYSGHFHHIITPNVLIRIYPDGSILYSIRVSLKLSCPMDLSNYPMDNQMCSIVVASYAYTTDDIVFMWKEGDPVQISKRISLPKFSMNSFETGYCTSRTNTGEYSCLKVDMKFSRSFFYYLQRAFMPTAALVLLSFVVFWLSPRCTNIRLGIWVGILVSIVIVNTAISNKSPEVSYTKALDVWMGICISFIFAVGLEICIASVLTHDDVVLNQLVIDDEKNAIRDERGKKNNARSYTSFPFKWLNKYTTRALRLDVACRFLFPAAFAFFNFVYWVRYAGSK